MKEEVLPIINPLKCNGCGVCVMVCPSRALAIVNGIAVIVHPETCQYDGSCEMLCPAGAINRPFEIVLADMHPTPAEHTLTKQS